MRAELTPVLLQALAQVADDPAAIVERDDYLLHIYAMFLLACWREAAAFALLVRLFASDSDLIEDITGDVITENLQSLLASVFPGELVELDRLVFDKSIFPWRCSSVSVGALCRGRSGARADCRSLSVMAGFLFARGVAGRFCAILPGCH